MMSAALRRVLREPLFQFAAIGAAIWAVVGLTGPSDDSAPPERIVIGSAEIARLERGYLGTWGRAPTPPQLEALIEKRIEEEVLYRAATRLDLLDGDAVVRGRMAHKMRVLMAGMAPIQDPGDDRLRALLLDGGEAYRRPDSWSFDQVALPPGITPLDREALRQRLENGAAIEGLSRLRTLPVRISSQNAVEIDKRFGSGFAAKLTELPRNRWSGPVQSGFGAHLVRIVGHVPGGLPAFEELRPRLLARWRAEERERIFAQEYRKLRGGFDVVVKAP